MGTLIFILQVASALVFVILMAIQTDKAEQSGVMGLGAQGGAMRGSIDMPVGAERILKPMTKWIGVAFLFLSALAAINGEIVQTSNGREQISIIHFVVALVVYFVVMLFGDRMWSAAIGQTK